MRRGLVVAALTVLGSVLLVAPGVAQAAATLDQEQTAFSTAYGVSGGDFTTSLAQTFTAGLSGGLNEVDLALCSGSDASLPLSVDITSVSGGAPGSTVLASATVPVSSVTASCAFSDGAFVAVDFASPAPVVAGTQYAIVAYSADQDGYGWGGSTYDAYAGGAGWLGDSSPPTTAWAQFEPNSIDMAFETYVVSACEAGTYSASGYGSSYSSSGSVACTPASAGDYVATAGSTSQAACGTGSYQPNTGQTSCEPAGIGFYVASTGQSSETACPTGDTTASTGSTAQSACIPIPPAATMLTAAPELVLFEPHAGVGANVVSATLTSGGQPVSGATISFNDPPFHLCTAVTNPNGVATCRLNNALGLWVVLTDHYSATYAGNSNYQPASASTPTIVFH